MTAVFAAVAVLVLGHRVRIRAHRRFRATRPGTGGRIDRCVGLATSRLSASWSRRTGITPLAVAEWCAGLSRATRSGDTLRFALERHVVAEGTLRDATEPLRSALERGRTVAVAAELCTTGAQRGRHHLALACDVMATCDRVGGSATAPLERAAAALRLRAADDQERAAQSAQARLSAHAMTVVPLVVLALFAATDAGIRAALVTPAGAICVAAGGLLNVAGWMWMRRIIRGVDP